MSTTPAITILKPGPLTTVQDMGRSGFASLGVPQGGACDAPALQAGNLLVGNAAHAAALEVTLGGLALRFECEQVFAITGASAAAALDGQRLTGWTRYRAAAGSVLRIGYAERGARMYLCVNGGIDVPLLFGSAATGLAAGLGGFQGRALMAGDALPLHVATVPIGDAAIRAPGRGDWLRVLPGPEWSLLNAAAQRALLGTRWQVAAASNRMGSRLQGAELDVDLPELASHAVQAGVVQLPSSGEPILLLADAQVTGGYAKPLVVIQADLWRAAQYRPGESLRFMIVSAAEALDALRQQRAWLAKLSRMLRLSA